MENLLFLCDAQEADPSAQSATAALRVDPDPECPQPAFSRAQRGILRGAGNYLQPESSRRIQTSDTPIRFPFPPGVRFAPS